MGRHDLPSLGDYLQKRTLLEPYMNFRLTHPVLHQLLWQRAAAKMKGIGTRLFAPRQWFVTILALGLACVWLSQIVVSVFLRQPADPVMLAERIALGMMGFTLWQVAKVIFRKPVEPFEWTPCEMQMLKSAPIDRRELVGYRLLTTGYSVLLKAACFVLVMIPDLHYLLVGFVGCVLGLAFCEFAKTVIEVVLFGIGNRGRLVFRILSGIGIASVLVICTAKAACHPDATKKLASPAAWEFLLAIAYAGGELTRSGIGAVIAAPFRFFSAVILTKSLDISLGINLLTAFVMSAGSLWAALNADQWMVSNRRRLEQKDLRRARLFSSGATKSSKTGRRKVPVPSRLGGVGSIAWRQFLGAWHYRSSIFFSFLLPVILCCVPLFAHQRHGGSALFLVASVAFYSYLLLPAALMLDFRRDVDRLSVLKSLPISSTNIVLGQLVVPVTMCSFFQAIVFAISAIAGVASAGWLLTCWLAFIPMNVLIMSFENLIFMLHPYRRNKEGVDVFLRTILTFTGKGLTWGAGAALVFLWALGCKYLAENVIVFSGVSPALVGTTLLLGGCTLLVMSVSTAIIACLVRLFDRYDPSSDSVAMN